MESQMNRFQYWVMAMALAVSITGCSTNPVSGEKQFTLVSEEQEKSMGARAHQQALKKYPPYKNAALQSYVNRIGQNLAKHSHRNNIRYTFTVVDSPEVNAFALPGGYIYITRGLMSYLNSEGELAGVLGHEIGHVTARHSANQMTRGTLTNVLTRVLADKYGNAQLFSMAGALSTRGFSRKHELQADRLGAEYLARVGYAPENMLKVIRVLKAQEEFSKALARKEGRQPPSYHGVFATHPDNDQRLKTVIFAAKNIRTAGSRSDNARGYLNMINHLDYNTGKKTKGKIVLITARPGDTFASLARRSPIKKNAEQKLRLLNGLYPKGEPLIGQLIKIVQ
jgi:predicted Zn-dependent protease